MSEMITKAARQELEAIEADMNARAEQKDTKFRFKHAGIQRMFDNDNETEFKRLLGTPDGRWYRSIVVANALKYVHAELMVLADELHADLDARLKALEATQLHYEGTWEPGGYTENTLITDKSTLWVARRATNTRPGTDDSWRLMVKSPRATR